MTSFAFLEELGCTSQEEYLNLEVGFCGNKYVLDHFSSIKHYRQFVFDQIAYARELEKVKHLTLE